MHVSCMRQTPDPVLESGSMHLPIDEQTVERCRALAGDIAADVQRFIDRHTTVSIERTVLRAYGVDGADPDGVALHSGLGS